MGRRRFHNDPLKRIQDDLKRLTKPHSGLLLAVSGGSDSTGLVYIAARFAEQLRLRLAIGFIDHGLREEVKREFALVERHGERLGVPVHYAVAAPEDVAVSGSSGSVQDWARKVRYRLLTQMAGELGMDAIATGHTQDDQAETVLIRIVRGTGMDGLSGIPEQRVLSNGISVIRPLLRVTRQELRDYLTSVKATWSDDPSNLDQRFLRVRMRREVLPLLLTMQPAIHGHLSALASDASSTTEYLDKHLSESVISFKNLNLSNGVKVEYEQFARLPEQLWGRAVRLILKRVRGNLRKIERTHVEPVVELISKKKSTGILAFPEDVAVYVVQGSVYAFKTPFPAKLKEFVSPEKVSPRRWRMVWDNLGVTAEIRAPGSKEVEGLVMRTRLPGDYLWKSKRKMKDVFIQKKVPRPYRDIIPVIASGRKIIACPGFVPSRKAALKVSWKVKKSSFLNDLGNLE